MDYPLLRLIHIGTVHISLSLFLLRAFWMLRDSPHRHARWAHTLPHVNDTLLLGSAIAMLFTADINPLDTPWLIAKISGLCAYIVLGSIALKRGRSKKQRVAALVAALAAFAYIIGVAITKQPMLF